MLLAGPMLCGFTQTLNDWFDREIDAINEPSRPIPSGAIGKVRDGNDACRVPCIGKRNVVDLTGVLYTQVAPCACADR